MASRRLTPSFRKKHSHRSHSVRMIVADCTVGETAQSTQHLIALSAMLFLCYYGSIWAPSLCVCECVHYNLVSKIELKEFFFS